MDAITNALELLELTKEIPEDTIDVTITKLDPTTITYTDKTIRELDKLKSNNVDTPTKVNLDLSSVKWADIIKNYNNEQFYKKYERIYSPSTLTGKIGTIYVDEYFNGLVSTTGRSYMYGDLSA